MACLFAAGSLGCSSHQKPKVAGSLEATPLAQARVFDQNKLIHGGKLLVVPFSAGKNVVASDQLGRCFFNACQRDCRCHGFFRNQA